MASSIIKFSKSIFTFLVSPLKSMSSDDAFLPSFEIDRFFNFPMYEVVSFWIVYLRSISAEISSKKFIWNSSGEKSVIFISAF